MSATRIALALSLALSALPIANAEANTIRLPDPHDYCTTGWVLQHIKDRVGGRFRKYHYTDLFLIDIVNPTEERANPRDEEHLVGRKFCHATAMMSDGRGRDLWYLIEYPWGFAGAPLSGLEFCIAGIDPWHVYGKNCSTVR